MENHLDLLLQEVKKDKGEEKQRKCCISSNKLSQGLLRRINQAARYMPDQF